MCNSRKNPYPPHGRSLVIPRGRGVLKVKILEAKYEAKLEFPGGWGVQIKKPSVGGVWIFSRTAQSTRNPTCSSTLSVTVLLLFLLTCSWSVTKAGVASAIFPGPRVVTSFDVL